MFTNYSSASHKHLSFPARTGDHLAKPTSFSSGYWAHIVFQHLLTKKPKCIQILCLLLCTSPACTHSKSTAIHWNKYVNKPCVDELRLPGNCGVVWQVAQEVDLHAVNKQICQPKVYFLRRYQEDCPVCCTVHCPAGVKFFQTSSKGQCDPWSDFATIMRIRPAKIQEFPCGFVEVKIPIKKTHTLLLALFLFAENFCDQLFQEITSPFFFPSPPKKLKSKFATLSKDLQLQQEQALRGSETVKYSKTS